MKVTMKPARLMLIALSFTAALFFAGGCRSPLMEKPDLTEKTGGGGEGILMVSLSGVNVNPSLNARTMLPLNPEFTRYELEFTDSSGTPLPNTNASYREPYSFSNSGIQLKLPEAVYYIVANGYNGDVLAAKSAVTRVEVTDGTLTSADFTLEPYMGDAMETGVLSYSLGWEGLSRMPWRAELLIEYYDSAAAAWAPIPPSNIPIGSTRGTILLLSRDDALVNLTGSLILRPGEYKLTMSLTLDEGTNPVSRFDIAHVYSNLTTPGAFYYGGGDLLISNTSPDAGVSFITSFTFTEIPNATTVIGAAPGPDGRRLIMIMAPEGTDLKNLTPKVECAEGSFITSPVPGTPPTESIPKPGYARGEIDFTTPTVWIAQAKNGATQEYTVVVSSVPVDPSNRKITYFFFEGYADYPGIIDQAAETIIVRLPWIDNNNDSVGDINLAANTFTPVISIIGQRVVFWDGTSAAGSGDTALTSSSAINFSSPKKFRVYPTSGATDPKPYTVTVEVGQSTEKEITHFSIDGYPAAAAVINPGAGGGQGSITATLPYGVSLANLIPLIQYKGKTLGPVSGMAQNFSVPVYYTVTAGDDTTKTYRVTLGNEQANKDTGIFDFVITNVPAAKVVIGQKPRQDGKIPIVIQVPYGTDETNLIPAITLRSSTSTINPVSGAKIPFGNQSNNQEAVYTVSSQGSMPLDPPAAQQYVVVVSQDVQYYYVNGAAGRDDWPDIYNGGSESYPFKTLSYAVSKAAASSSIDHIFVSGELNTANQAGGGNANSVIAINGTGNPAKTITVTGVGGSAVLRGTTGKRVLSVTGGADLVFENITVAGGRAGTEDGGGLHISGSSKVKFSGGSITDNRARSGGGVFVGTGSTDMSEFTLMGGSISGNSATGTAAGADNDGMWTSTPPSIEGGGGVCVSGNALFWLTSGTVSNNTTSGSGGGVLVRGLRDFLTPNNDSGFLMSGGSVAKNNSNGNSSPHGGGGVYVASGDFSIAGGEITFNTSVRQGGGVFVHSGASFEAWGNSSITGNEGVGSSKDICSRGQTTLKGNSQADTIYVWNPLAADAGATGIYQHAGYNKFAMGENARVKGIVLAYSAEYRNYIDIYGPIPGSDQIGIIDLEGHLTNYKFVDTDINDWLNKAVLRGGSADISSTLLKRFSLGVFVGGSPINLSAYQLSAAPANTAPVPSGVTANYIGKLVRK